MSVEPIAYNYQAGGSLPPDAPTYVVRQADTELLRSLREGTYCYVLNSRQMGKSSLRIRTMARLEAEGIACAEIELSGIGSQQITASQWYGGIIQELVSGLGLKINRRQWLQEHDDLSPVQRLSLFVETVLLAQIPRPIVIFIDEIDSVLGLGFSTDDFFSFIRLCYEKRAQQPEYNRITFALLGVATPSDLMQDEHTAPFNIGRAIELRGFQLHESLPLVEGLQHKAENPLAVFKAVLGWTGGQPFLTQKLCWILANHSSKVPLGQEETWVEQIVRTRIIEHWEAQDSPEHLRTIRDRLLRNTHDRKRILLLYRQILRGRVYVRHSREHLELRLSGLVVQESGVYRVYNRLYRTIFNLAWIRRQLGSIQGRVSQVPLWAAAGIGLAATILVTEIRSLGWLQSLELQIYDHLIQMRPAEPPDPRILLITITEQDIQSQPARERGNASLSDRSLLQLLTKLEAAQPAAIGLDLYRDYPTKPEVPQLANRLRQNPRFVAICKYGDYGVAPPPEVSNQQQGFNNVTIDEDEVQRRHLLAVDPTPPCQTSNSFSLQLALRYLARHNITLESSLDRYIQLGSKVFRTLESRTVAYQGMDHSGHQVMLNYRAVHPIAQMVTLGQVLSDQFDPALVRDRIVMIGTTAPSFNDHRWRTPYSGRRGLVRTISGVEIQAHMVSQILSAVLDNRPLIWWLNQPLEWLWIGSWAILGLVIERLCRSRTRMLLVTVVALLLLYGGCLGILVIYGGWIPLVPPGLALVLTIGGLSTYRQ